eukprot:CAMPEP_0113683026 /NCGR_PEP_ID=MMETSP0038_2-20120614/13038_1 /TAXON_ID=2898 /ORGANISM="Cryptomonas paramecium" /LENGTH=47 /DNA_ID=CAMNT_0000602257 /DNA_START=46 /DNA_END=186 /DNA_ORIENTATION=+ /assembly_acc=CAM_ASM_000170
MAKPQGQLKCKPQASRRLHDVKLSNQDTAREQQDVLVFSVSREEMVW